MARAPQKTDEGLAKNLGHKIAFRRAVAIAFGGIYFLPQTLILNRRRAETQPLNYREMRLVAQQIFAPREEKKDESHG